VQSQRRLSDVVKRSLIPVQGSFGVCGSGFGVWSLLRAYSVVGFGFRVSGFGFRVFGAARRQSRVSAEAHCVCNKKSQERKLTSSTINIVKHATSVPCCIQSFALFRI
jgi:hypothetical protein